MIDIIHISDLHCGSKKEFKEELLLNVIDYINTKKPDVVINTGDIAHRGKEDQYQQAKMYLDTIKVPMITTPGNHDMKKNGIIFFEQYVGERRTSKVINDTHILGLRSSKDGNSEGEIGDEQFQWIADQITRYPDVKHRVFALHHHMINVPAAGIKRNTLIDSGDALEVVRRFNIDLVLMGHRHVPHMWEFHDSILLYCGTSASTKVRGRDVPSFNHITITDDEIIAYIVDSTTLEKHLLVHKKLGKIVKFEPRDDYLEHLWKSGIFHD